MSANSSIYDERKVLDFLNLLQGVSWMHANHSKNLLFIPEQNCGNFHLRPQYVSFRDQSKLLTLPPEDVQQLMSINYEHPSKKHISYLETLKLHYPSSPEIKNLLNFLYVKLKKLKKAEALILEAYQAHPDDIITKINYADSCLRKHEIKKIPIIFNNAFDLKLLYPSREVFHISEFRGFMTLMGFYHLAIKEREQAECYHYLARRVDPHHPAVRLLTRSLYYKNLFKKLIVFLKIKKH